MAPDNATDKAARAASATVLPSRQGRGWAVEGSFKLKPVGDSWFSCPYSARSSISKPLTCRTKSPSAAENEVDPSLPLRDVVKDLYGTDPTRETMLYCISRVT